MRFVNRSCLTGSLALLFSIQTCSSWARIDTLRTFPEKRFVNGKIAFGQHIMKSLRYPLQAQQAAIVGTSLVSFIITPTGKLTNVAIVNSLGKAIDGEVRRVIYETSKRWLPDDQSASQDSSMLFLAVKFLLGDESGSNEFYVDSVKPGFILNEIIVVGYSSQVTHSSVRDDAYYINELSASLPKKDYERMLKMVNELIRRNPYSDKLYLQRANIERELGQTEEACRDYKKIIYFLGKTHFPKHFLKNCTDLASQEPSGTASAQPAEPTPILEEIFTVCQTPPSFPGGPAELSQYIQQNLRYPEAALIKKVQGKVLISFIVTKEGLLQDISILKGPGYGLKEEAMRLIQSMPSWNPGKQSGRPVNVKYNLVIPFTVADTK